MAYPCTCTYVDYNPPSSNCGSGTCLKIPRSIVVSAEDSVAGCGGEGTIDIAAESDLTGCTTSINWGLYNTWDSAAFEDASLNSSGVLSFTFSDSAQLNTPYLFTGVVTCEDTLLSQYFKVTVYVKNLCVASTICAEGQTCNPCTGLCADEIDVELS